MQALREGHPPHHSFDEFLARRAEWRRKQLAADLAASPNPQQQATLMLTAAANALCDLVSPEQAAAQLAAAMQQIKERAQLAAA